MKAVNQADRVFIFSAVGISLASWQFGFNIGAFQTIFFEHVFTVWIASLAVMLACLCLPTARRPITGLGLLALASPTLWLVSQLLSFVTAGSLSWVSFLVGTAVLAISLPYVGYVLVSITQADGQALNSKRHLWGLISLALGIGLLGMLVGHYHHFLLTCDDFKLSGSYTPSNCWSEGSTNLDPQSTN